MQARSHKRRSGYRRSLKRDLVESRVLSAIQEHFLDAATYDAFRNGFEEEIDSLERSVRASQKSVQRDIAAAEKRVAHYVEALGAGLKSEAVTRELQKAEAQVATLRARLEWRRPTTPSRNLPEIFRAEFERLVENLSGARRLEAQEKIREHVDHVLIPEGDLPFRLVGNAATLLAPVLGSIVGCGGSQPAVLAAMEQRGMTVKTVVTASLPNFIARP